MPADALAKGPPLVSPAGTSAGLDAWRGRVVLVNFWATWCGPCREEMPDLDRLDATLDHQKAAIVGIAANEAAEVRTFLKRLPVRYPILVGAPDPVLAWSAQLGNRSLGLPFSVLVDGKGQIRWVKSGGRLTYDEARAEMLKLLPPPRS
jgi:thiol-disulfide isomerase/thioredoxin